MTYKQQLQTKKEGQEPRGTGPEIYPSNDGKNPSFGRVFPSKPGLFPSQTNVQSLWVDQLIG